MPMSQYIYIKADDNDDANDGIPHRTIATNQTIAYRR